MTRVSQDVRSHINDFLDELENEYNFTVLLAVAHGSHAWGLSSDNSDYDIQIVYAPNSIRHFAHLSGRTSTLERVYQGPYDIEVSGWDVTKFASLLHESNDQAIDTLRSPIAYRKLFDPTELREYMADTFSPIALYHAYRGIATNNYRRYLSHHLVDNDKNTYRILRVADYRYILSESLPDGTDMIGKALLNDGEKYEHFKETQTRQTVKRNLAVMKATMSARYLLHTGENSTHQLPNVDFPTFLDEEAPGVFDQSRIETAQRLVEKKQNGNGAEEIGDVVGRDFAHPPEDIDGETHVTTKPDQERLNDFIDSMIDSL